MSRYEVQERVVFVVGDRVFNDLDKAAQFAKAQEWIDRADEYAKRLVNAGTKPAQATIARKHAIGFLVHIGYIPASVQIDMDFPVEEDL